MPLQAQQPAEPKQDRGRSSTGQHEHVKLDTAIIIQRPKSQMAAPAR